jgi:hypothetical protein
MADGRTENLDKQIGGAIGDGGMFGKLVRGHDQDSQFNELFQAIDIPEVFLSDPERISAAMRAASRPSLRRPRRVPANRELVEDR